MNPKKMEQLREQINITMRHGIPLITVEQNDAIAKVVQDILGYNATRYITDFVEEILLSESKYMDIADRQVKFSWDHYKEDTERNLDPESYDGKCIFVSELARQFENEWELNKKASNQIGHYKVLSDHAEDLINWRSIAATYYQWLIGDSITKNGLFNAPS